MGNDSRTLDAVRAISPTIKDVAPHWLELIEFASDDSFSPSPINLASVSISGYYAVIVLLMAYKLRPKKVNNFQMIMGLYLMQGGARRRVIDTFCRFSLTKSYPIL